MPGDCWARRWTENIWIWRPSVELAPTTDNLGSVFGTDEHTSSCWCVFVKKKILLTGVTRRRRACLLACSRGFVLEKMLYSHMSGVRDP